MDRPATISRYIMLKTAEPIDKEVMHRWFNAAKTFLPNGVIASVQSTDDRGNLRSAILVHREVDGKNEYFIPLSRDIMDQEAEKVVNAFASECPLQHFEIEVSSAQANKLNNFESNIEVEKTKYHELCSAWAKKQHEDWLKDRIDGGWTYGTTISLKNKTHPLIRQWHELPDQFKKIDLDQPQSLLNLLNDQGYTVISKSELESLLALVSRSI